MAPAPSPTPSPTSEKLKFKDKLKNIIAEAEVAQAKALREEQTQDARSLATDILVQGHPSAFCGEPSHQHMSRCITCGNSHGRFISC
jgi:hypothetical protein